MIADQRSALLKNAVDAFECGTEDFVSGTDARLKSALRNVYASVLLLFKERLRQLSPPDSNEALIKKVIVPKLVAGKIQMNGKGNNTADYMQIKERFAQLEIEADWSDFNDVRRIRNDVEHYFTLEPQKSIEEAISKSFRITVNFIRREFEEDPKDYFSDDCWARLIEVSKIFDDEQTVCVESQKYFRCSSATVTSWLEKFSCTNCSSTLILLEDEGSATCRSCGCDWSTNALALAIAAQVDDDQSMFAVYEGDDPLVVACPFCSEFSCIVTEATCFICEESPAQECCRCSNGIPVCEWSEDDACAYCTHMMYKDD